MSATMSRGVNRALATEEPAAQLLTYSGTDDAAVRKILQATYYL